MLIDEPPDVVRKGYGSDTHITHRNSPSRETLARFLNRRIGRAKPDQPDLGTLDLVDDRHWEELARVDVFAHQALHVVFPVVRSLAVDRFFGVAGPAGKIRAERVFVPWERAIRDPIAVHVSIAGERAHSFKFLGSEDLAPVHGLGRGGERVG